ncbi:hypothetical protein [Bacillus sonorensis]|uniref:hypothetical protein n=1 Tax=Bacillus sonorensis TaxID=119858 RepID=UPI00098AB411|nr:hypothetical protein [Bacillus sonorensis]
MTKTNEKIHVLADESLGGIKREYVEVERKAAVGDKIIVTEGDDFPVGHIDTVTYWYAGYDDGSIDLSEGVDNDVFLDGAREEYCVLEPTNIVHVDGERYEMVDRKAEVGERAIFMSENKSDGVVRKVTRIDIYGDIEFDPYVDDEGDRVSGWIYGGYRVLVPVESSEEEEPQPSDPIDVIANLATRVAELERENKRIKEELGWNEMGPGRIAELRNADSDIRHDIAALEEKFEHDRAENEDMSDFLYEEMKRMKDEIDTLHKDNRRHGEELEALKYATKETDGKAAHLESDSDMRLFTFKEVSLLLNAVRERQ